MASEWPFTKMESFTSDAGLKANGKAKAPNSSIRAVGTQAIGKSKLKA